MTCIVISSCKLEDEKKIISSLLENRLAACISTFSITSKYIWKGKVERQCEKLLLIKTALKHYNSVENMIKKHNSYDIPEILCIPVEKGLKDYIKWINDEVV